jgi:hypothetical protein
MSTITDLMEAYKEYDIINEDEEDRLESIRMYDLYMIGVGHQLTIFLVSRQEERAHQRRSGQQKVWIEVFLNWYGC